MGLILDHVGMDSYCSHLANTDIVDELCDFIITKLLSFFIKIDTPSVITDLKKGDQQRNFPLLPFWGLVNSVVGQCMTPRHSRDYQDKMTLFPLLGSDMLF